MTIIEILDDFINKAIDPREQKRAIAVKMQLQGLSYQKINQILSCSSSFISKWKKIFSEQGVEELKLKYQGGKSYLSAEQEKEVIQWIEKENWLTRETLEQHIANKYDVVFASLQSYYKLLKKGGMSWKKSQKNNPKRNDELVEIKKKEIKKNWQNIKKR